MRFNLKILVSAGALLLVGLFVNSTAAQAQSLSSTPAFSPAVAQSQTFSPVSTPAPMSLASSSRVSTAIVASSARRQCYPPTYEVFEDNCQSVNLKPDGVCVLRKFAQYAVFDNCNNPGQFLYFDTQQTEVDRFPGDITTCVDMNDCLGQ